jgi:hypothetical protein
VTIATVPTLSFRQAIAYNLEKGKLRYTKFTDEDLNDKQTRLNDMIKSINERILTENSLDQEISGIGQYKLGNLFFHQNVEKSEIKTKKGKKVYRTRIPTTALVDGVHVNKDIALKWYRAMHYNFMKCYDWLESKIEINKCKAK